MPEIRRGQRSRQEALAHRSQPLGNSSRQETVPEDAGGDGPMGRPACGEPRRVVARGNRTEPPQRCERLVQGEIPSRDRRPEARRAARGPCRRRHAPVPPAGDGRRLHGPPARRHTAHSAASTLERGAPIRRLAAPRSVSIRAGHASVERGSEHEEQERRLEDRHHRHRASPKAIGSFQSGATRAGSRGDG
jgi:hypothetical protein